MKKFLNLLMITVLIFSTVFSFSGCEKEKEKEWWEDLDNLEFRLYDIDAEPNEIVYKIKVPTELEVTYIYDGEKHVPQIEMIYKGESKGYGMVVFIYSIVPYSESWERTGTIINSGKYKVEYWFYSIPNADKFKDDYFTADTCYVNVIKE